MKISQKISNFLRRGRVSAKPEPAKAPSVPVKARAADKVVIPIAAGQTGFAVPLDIVRHG